MGIIFLRNKVAAGGGAFDPSTISGMVAAWDMATVYQDSGLTTAVSDGDPIGGIPDLAGNGNILSQSGSARPLRQSSGGLYYADMDDIDDYFDMTLPTGDRTSNMTLMLAVEFDAAETQMCMASADGSTGSPFFGIGLDGNGSGISGGSGSVTAHVDNGSSLTTRDAMRDALVAAGACVWECRAIDWTTTGNGGWATVTTPVLMALGGTIYRSNVKIYRGALVDAATISAGDLTATRTWVGEGAGVTL